MTELSHHEDTYKNLAEDPNRWMSSARNLLAAADQLWVSVRGDLDAVGRLREDEGRHADVTEYHGADRPLLQYAAVYLMVAGFALENALKAVVIRHEKAAATQELKGKLRMAPNLQTHDLRRLADDACISLSESEKDLLDRLRAYLVWAGRYPVATTADGQAVVQNIWRSDQEALSGVFRRIEAVFVSDV